MGSVEELNQAKVVAFADSLNWQKWKSTERTFQARSASHLHHHMSKPLSSPRQNQPGKNSVEIAANEAEVRAKFRQCFKLYEEKFENMPGTPGQPSLKERAERARALWDNMPAFWQIAAAKEAYDSLTEYAEGLSKDEKSALHWVRLGIDSVNFNVQALNKPVPAMVPTVVQWLDRFANPQLEDLAEKRTVSHQAREKEFVGKYQELKQSIVSDMANKQQKKEFRKSLTKAIRPIPRNDSPPSDFPTLPASPNESPEGKRDMASKEYSLKPPSSSSPAQQAKKVSSRSSSDSGTSSEKEKRSEKKKNRGERRSRREEKASDETSKGRVLREASPRTEKGSPPVPPFTKPRLRTSSSAPAIPANTTNTSVATPTRLSTTHTANTASANKRVHATASKRQTVSLEAALPSRMPAKLMPTALALVKHTEMLQKAFGFELVFGMYRLLAVLKDEYANPETQTFNPYFLAMAHPEGRPSVAQQEAFKDAGARIKEVVIEEDIEDQQADLLIEFFRKVAKTLETLTRQE